MIRQWIAGFLLAAATSYAQQPVNTEAQRAAMKKLDFLAGKWSGGANVSRGPGQPIQVTQTEDVQYRMDGLVLVVEGTGRNPQTGEVIFRAFAVISYDDAASKYNFRAYNDGRYLDTELKVPDKGLEWGFKPGPVSIKYAMRLNDKGEWVETGETTLPNGQTMKTLEMTLQKQR